MFVYFLQQSASQFLLVIYQGTIGRAKYVERIGKQETYHEFVRRYEGRTVCDKQARMVSSGYDTTIGFCAVSAGCVNLQCLLPVLWGEKNQDEPLGRGTTHALEQGLWTQNFPSQSQSCPFIRLV